MTQGLCMWSAAGKLILCNRRYVEMYELSPRLAQPGSTLREMVRASQSSSEPSPAIRINTSPT